MFKEFFRGIIDFILPPVCVSCGEYTRGGFLCRKCSGGLVRFTGEHPWKTEHKNKGYIDDSFSLYRFIKDTPVQNLLHSLKYEKMKSIGTMLGREMANYINSNDEYDFCVPVPLHTAKLRERTYNQSYYICLGFAGTAVLPDSLKRVRFTPSQTKLNKASRIQNVEGAFAVNDKIKNAIRGKNIIICDDVITTGATIIECAKVLKKNGAGKIMVCSAAYDEID
jgi:ComF family protein